MSTDFQSIPQSKDIKGSYSFISLGCPKNTVDSERMMGLLKLDGYQMVADPVGSDFVIVNTCGFIEQARAESFAAIDEMLDLKREGKTRGLIVSGCLAERQKEQLLEDRPEIDALVGVFGREEITKIADRLVGDLAEQRIVFQPAPIPRPARRRSFADYATTFCLSEDFRGLRSTLYVLRHSKDARKARYQPIENVIAEARQLAKNGVRELIIVAQDTTYYGMDLYGEPRLAELLEQLDEVEGLDWIRLMYFYPMYIDEKLLTTIAKCKRIVPYIDMPLQHADDVMLRRMSRRVNQQQMNDQIDMMRRLLPNLVLRTTFITGFPGETEEQFQELVDFVKRHKFERMGVFTYSFEPDTPAARMDGHLDDDTKEDRRARLMQVQQEIMFEYNQSQVGKFWM